MTGILGRLSIAIVLGAVFAWTAVQLGHAQDSGGERYQEDALGVPDVLLAEDRTMSDSGVQSFSASMGFAADVDSGDFGGRRFTYSKFHGVLINSADGGFVHQSRMQCRSVNDNGFVSGYCTVTDADEDRLYLMIQRAGTPEISSGPGGEMLFIGGTGKYSGIQGGATYAVEYEPGNSRISARGMMSMEGTFRMP